MHLMIEIIETKKDLVEDLEKLKQDTVELQVIRQGKKIPVSLSPVKDIKGEYKLGIWVRDNTQGIGTLTLCGSEWKLRSTGSWNQRCGYRRASSY